MLRSMLGMYRWFRRRTKRTQIGIVFLVGALLVGLILFAGNTVKQDAEILLPAVSVKTVHELSESSDETALFGTVRSVTEATILSEVSGAVRRVHTTLGAEVPAGFIIAELENARERAALLSAEGVYDAALASRASLSIDTTTAVENAYRTAFTALETTIENDIDTFFGTPTSYGPKLLITGADDAYQTLPGMRRTLEKKMDTWRNNLTSIELPSEEAMLLEASTAANDTSTLLTDLAESANNKNSGASVTQLSALAAARASVDALITSLSSVENTYEEQQSGSAAISLSDANVKQALGALRLAQSNLEQTLVRSPIGGTINFLPIHVGDYVTAFTHVATVAQNGALEITANVSEKTREYIAIGDTVLVEGIYPAIVTSISPALNPITKQVEVRFAAGEGSPLTNGASVRIALSSTNVSETKEGLRMLPLTSVKLLPDSRAVFTVDETMRLVALPVTTGNVRGARIEITSELREDLPLVVDVRGRFEGERVRVAPSTP